MTIFANHVYNPIYKDLATPSIIDGLLKFHEIYFFEIFHKTHEIFYFYEK